MIYSFFLVMGGFTLHCDERGTALRILEPMELESLSETGKIEWLSTTEKEIQDRSKGDYLSKGIVFVQTSWFITQCIARGVYKLEVAELDVATLAFAALNGLTTCGGTNPSMFVVRFPCIFSRTTKKKNWTPRGYLQLLELVIRCQFHLPCLVNLPKT